MKVRFIVVGDSIFETWEKIVSIVLDILNNR